MDDFATMQVGQPAKNVINDAFDLRLVEVLSRLDKFLQIHVALAQDKVNLVELQVLDLAGGVAENAAGWNDTEKLVAAGVGHCFQNCHLAQ